MTNGEPEGGDQPVGLMLLILAAATAAFLVWDIARTPRYEVRVFSKPVWILLILLMLPIGGVLLGAIVWFLFGRPRSPLGLGRRESARRQHPAYGGRSRWDNTAARRPDALGARLGWTLGLEPGRPMGPDDDPEFLRELSDRIHRQDPDGPAPRP
jgi:hypothetical protein